MTTCTHLRELHGNEAQFKFTKRLLDHIQEAQECMKRKNDEGNTGNGGRCGPFAQQTKMIKLADRSELGWSVVEEYEADELADNSEDEKKIARAEKEAERKAIKRKKRFAEGQLTEERQLQRSGHHSAPRLHAWVRALVVAKSDTFGNSAPNWYPCLNLPWLLNSTNGDMRS